MNSLASGSMTTEAAPVGIKLRESCDACLQAKVKCSKSRPVCTRCLSNGSPCQYSPSARAGRKNRHGGVKKSVSDTASHQNSASTRTPGNTSASSAISQWPLGSPAHNQADHMAGTTSEYNDASSNLCPFRPPGASHCCGTATPPLTIEDEASGMSTQHFGDTTKQEREDEFHYKFLPTPPFHSLEFGEDSRLDIPFSASTDIAFGEYDSCPPPIYTDQAFNPDPWIGQDPTFHATQPLNHTTLESTFLDTLSPLEPLPDHITPNNNDAPKLPPSDFTTNECDCFADCLQSLAKLHEQSTPQIDVVLQINSAAVNVSNKMLTCMPCSNRVGVGVSAMLIATLIGKSLSLYRAAVLNRFEPTDPSRTLQSDGRLAFGAYQLDGEDRLLLEIEILLYELKKVEKTIGLWREKSQQLTADGDAACMYEALVMYLEKNLHYVAEYLRLQRSGLPR